MKTSEILTDHEAPSCSFVKVEEKEIGKNDGKEEEEEESADESEEEEEGAKSGGGDPAKKRKGGSAPRKEKSLGKLCNRFLIRMGEVGGERGQNRAFMDEI